MTREEIIAKTKAQLGLDAIPANAWSLDQRQRYNKALAAAFLASPDSSAMDIANAQAVQDANYTPLDSYDLLDQAGDFVGEMANQAEEINPLSARNRTKTALMICAVLLVGVGVFAYVKAKA